MQLKQSALAKQALKKIPQKALTKTFYYPIIQSILKFFGVYLTKGSFAKGVAKVIPVVGAVVSGGITLASILPMGNRLLDTLDKAHFDYSDSDMEKDIEEIIEVCAKLEEEEATDTEAETADTITIENEETESSSIEENIIEVKPTEVTVTQREETNIDNSSVNKTNNTESQPIEKILAQIEKTKEMLDKGIITEEEFSIIKSKLIAQI
ncbi:MAG: SHOCT domain-containing protein [Acutalibacteraceae bacterium]|nr:SHOCT domain-containing protein [Acutalibacteraceae bacterium]